jgi:hypothetical protein
MIHELDTIVLARDLEEHGLTQGDVGAVVHCYKDGTTYEVEFVTGEGATIAVLTLSQHDIRPMSPLPPNLCRIQVRRCNPSIRATCFGENRSHKRHTQLQAMCGGDTAWTLPRSITF